MKKTPLFILLYFISLGFLSFGQDKKEYLKNNSFDLYEKQSLQLNKTKIMGFGALHGSAETETAEILLLKDLMKKYILGYYFIETDFSTAKGFQKFIETGDKNLLLDLIEQYGAGVPQEKSIETYNKWVKLQPIFKYCKVQILGADKISSFKYPVKSIVSLVSKKSNWPYIDSLSQLLDDNKTNWAVNPLIKNKSQWIVLKKSSYKKQLRNFIKDYEENKTRYDTKISDTTIFNHIISNLKKELGAYSPREPKILSNYVFLKTHYDLDRAMQFFRYGVFHIMKEKINGRSPFFNLLIENEIYQKDEILSIQGFLTKSRVLWDIKKDKNANYSGFTTKGGKGIADYCLEYYKGIKHLKRNKQSAITCYFLNGEKSPYKKENIFELVEIKKLFGRNFWKLERDKNTTDYIDYAILISNSKANRPLEELKK